MAGFLLDCVDEFLSPLTNHEPKTLKLTDLLCVQRFGLFYANSHQLINTRLVSIALRFTLE